MPKPIPKKAKSKSTGFTRALILALEPSGEAVTVSDMAGFIIEANRSVEKVYGWPISEVIGQHPLKFCPDNASWRKLSDEIWRAIEENGNWDGVVLNWDSNERKFPIVLRARRIEYKRQRYVVSWARHFPKDFPVGLSSQEGKCFELLGKGSVVPEIAETLPNMDKRKDRPRGIGVTTSSVNTHLANVWKKSGLGGKFNINRLRRLAIQSLDAGWDSCVMLNR